jgi:hypothetical protein
MGACVVIRPKAVTQGIQPASVILDDPRVDVRVLSAGEPAPHDGVWLNRWTFDLLIAKAKGQGLTKEAP